MNWKVATVAVSLMAAGAVIGAVFVSGMGSNVLEPVFAQVQDIGAKKSPVVPDDKSIAINNAFVAVSEAVMPTVVSISVETEQRRQRNRSFEEFFRFFEEEEGSGGGGEDMFRSRGSGSGVFISSDGYILTNNHVIDKAAKDGIRVITDDQREYVAKLIGQDPDTDLAVIKIEGEGFPACFIGNSEEVRIGEWVVAVGNPLGLRSTITAGIVSARGRGQLGLRNSQYAVEDFIQTDAAINPGNSGGGLFNLRGELVGINTAIATRTGYYQGYGFAIPSNLAKSVALDLMDDGKVNRGYIGVQIRSVDETYAKALGLEEVGGVLVDSVMTDGAGAAAGLQQGDVILEVDGKKVKTSNQLQSQIVRRRAGDKVKLTIWRDGKSITKTVTLKSRDGETIAARPGEPPRGEEEETKIEPVTLKRLGLTIAPLTREQKEEMSVASGVVVTDIERYGEAARRGLRPGDIIVQVDRKDIASVKSFQKIVDDKDPGSAILFKVQSRGASRIIALDIPRTKG